MRGYKWLVLALLVFAGALNYGDRTAITTVLPLLRADLHMSDVELGAIGAVFLWSYALISPFSGAMGDRFSRSAIIVFSLATWSAVMALTGLVSSVAWLLLMRALLGIAESFYIPAATGLIAEYHPSRTRALAMSIHTCGFYLGLSGGGTLASFLGDKHGWRFTLGCLGGAGVLLAAMAAILLVRKSPLAAAAGMQAGQPRLPAREIARIIIRSSGYWILVSQAVLASMGTWIFLHWLPLYFTETYKLTLYSAGVAGTLPLNIGAFAGLLLGGWFSDRIARRDPRRRMLCQAIFYFASVPALWFFAIRPALAVMYAAIFSFSFLRTFGQAGESPLLCELLPEASWSSATGVLNCANCIAGGFALLLAGVLKNALGLGMIFASISAIMAAAGAILAFGYFRILMRQRISSPRQAEPSQELR